MASQSTSHCYLLLHSFCSLARDTSYSISENVRFCKIVFTYTPFFISNPFSNQPFSVYGTDYGAHTCCTVRTGRVGRKEGKQTINMKVSCAKAKTDYWSDVSLTEFSWREDKFSFISCTFFESSACSDLETVGSPPVGKEKINEWRQATALNRGNASEVVPQHALSFFCLRYRH